MPRNGSADPAGSGTRRVRCVLWVPRGVAPPQELEAELDRKGISRASSDNAHGAMGLLCSWASTSIAGGMWPLRVIVLVEPELLLGAKAFLSVADRYAPDAARWVFRRGANPSLRAFVESDVATAEPVPGGVFSPAFRGTRVADGVPRVERRPNVGQGASRGPLLRLTDDPPVARPATDIGDDGLSDLEGGVGERGNGAPGVLTDEELSMLLGPDKERDERDRRGGRGGP